MAPLTGPKLGALAIEEALKRANVEKSAVDQVYMGNVLPAGLGQAPDRQATLFAGLPSSVPCTMVNKVNCSKIILKSFSNVKCHRYSSGLRKWDEGYHAGCRKY
jgi:acetyl-CoA C-acetyltransferase